MKQYKELESQELDNDDLQNVVGGLSQGVKEGLEIAGATVGLTVGAAGALMYGAEKAYRITHRPIP